MKRVILTIILTIAVTAGIPTAVIYYTKGEPSPPDSQTGKGEPIDDISVYIKAEDRVETMSVSQYLKEVVAAEMPATFYEEALKAQAVAARTYLLNRVNVHRDGTETPEHKGADICTDSTHCKAWISEKDRKTAWGEEHAEEYWKKIVNAVDSTEGLIITYEGNPISAVFHSTSSGHTENSKDVWGGDVPYLVSVASVGEELSPRYHSEREMTLDEFKKIAERNIENVDWSLGIVENIERSPAGGIMTLCVGGAEIKGSLFRTIFDLRSTNVQINIDGETVRMEVLGFGHGVGMSQYGANYLASQGKDYVEILKTYYTGVEIS